MIFYSGSVRHCSHYQLSPTADGRWLVGVKEFSTLDDLVDFYILNPITTKRLVSSVIFINEIYTCYVAADTSPPIDLSDRLPCSVGQTVTVLSKGQSQWTARDNVTRRIGSIDPANFHQKNQPMNGSRSPGGDTVANQNGTGKRTTGNFLSPTHELVYVWMVSLHLNLRLDVFFKDFFLLKCPNLMRYLPTYLFCLFVTYFISTLFWCCAAVNDRRSLHRFLRH